MNDNVEQKETLSMSPGNEVSYQNRKFRIAQILDLEYVLGRDAETGEARKLPIAKLSPAEKSDAPMPYASGEDLETTSDEDWSEAQEHFEVIRPLVGDKWRSRADVEERAEFGNVNTATVYRWLKIYEETGRISSLIPKKRGPKHGSVRLHPDVEAIVKQAIQDKYLSREKKKNKNKKNPRKRKIEPVIKQVEKHCRNARLPAPHPSTIRIWISRISEREKMKAQEGGAAVEQAYSPHRGKFPDGHWPLEVIQIDHTRLDIILVDDVYRRPVDRPWITIAIDVFSRMVTGFYISFDPPGNLSTGLCIAHSVLPKDSWMTQLGVEGSWPVWGKMRTLHMDNAGEFRSKMLEKVCKDYDIDITWRPVKKPNYGAHIERLLGTFNEEIHTLPGTTYSNPVERGNYDSEGDAAMTLSEFELWLADYIINIYHQRKHSSIGMPPIKKYEEGIFGSADTAGVGIQERILDEARLRLDLMPFDERTVQRYGIVWDKIEYYGDVLRTWINSKDPDNPREKRKFIVRRDPRAIDVVYFFDPELKQYFEIPYRDISHPTISIWELRETKKWLADQGNDDIDEEAIFEAYDRLHEIEQNAVKETKKARRKAQRKKGWDQAERPNVNKSPGDSEPVEEFDLNKIQPFDEMEDIDDEF